MVCKFFPYRVIWVEYTQNCIGPKCFLSSVCMLTWWVFLGLWTEIHVMFSWVQRRCWLVGSKGDQRILRRLKEMLDLIGLKETEGDVWPDKSQGDWRRCLTWLVKKSWKIFLVKKYPYHFWMRKIGKSFIKTSFCIFFFGKRKGFGKSLLRGKKCQCFYFKGEPENFMASSICFQTPILRNQKGILKRES